MKLISNNTLLPVLLICMYFFFQSLWNICRSLYAWSHSFLLTAFIAVAESISEIYARSFRILRRNLIEQISVFLLQAGLCRWDWPRYQGLRNYEYFKVSKDVFLSSFDFSKTIILILSAVQTCCILRQLSIKFTLRKKQWHRQSPSSFSVVSFRCRIGPILGYPKVYRRTSPDSMPKSALGIMNIENGFNR